MQWVRSDGRARSPSGAAAMDYGPARPRRRLTEPAARCSRGRMKAVILGGGIVGTQVAKELIREDKDVVLIERSAEAVQNLANTLDCPGGARQRE